MTDYIPPFPPRPAAQLSALQVIRRARRNFLEIFGERAFDFQLSVTQLLRRRIVICNHPELVQYAFSTKNASFERKSPQMRHALEPVAGDGLIISDGTTWRSRRKVVAPIIHVSRMRDFAPVMARTAVETRERWTSLSPGTELDMLGEMAELTAEIITRTVFGSELGPADAREVAEGFSDYQRAVGRMDVLSLMGVPDWFPRPHSLRVKRATRRIHAVLDRIIDGLVARGTAQNGSIVGRLLEARDEETGRPLSREAIRNEAAVMFLAGHETTANTLSFVWFLLSQAPEVEARLHAEIDSVLGGREPALADLPKLAWTRAVLEETLRLYPSIPLLARETLEEETIRERRVPKGSIVMVVPWLLHRHRQLWTDPDHFKPERFLPGSGEPVSKFAYIPFSIGPRICAGMSFGVTEAMLCIAVLAQRLRFRLKAGHVVEPVCRLTLRPGDHLPMHVEQREALVPAEPPPEAPAACPHIHG
ncbi:cytochrome P450 [Enterovirga rhinocerotis]|uniref:cytochrome P450 n=1 Tax=Enterovirga rhinocerotis TaxID=1339210 RepID=UPI001AADD169|nr:cytochrome P450 [Enterovirga rhinocerotis]